MVRKAEVSACEGRSHLAPGLSVCVGVSLYTCTCQGLRVKPSNLNLEPLSPLLESPGSSKILGPSAIARLASFGLALRLLGILKRIHGLGFRIILCSYGGYVGILADIATIMQGSSLYRACRGVI